jgi:8-oxo-dGTP diphosphatase
LHIRVVASIIEREDKLLLCERPAHKRHGGLWEFPGGKVESGESDFHAVERELAEELGVRVVQVGSVELSVRDPGSEFVIEFLPVVIEGEPRPLEHAALAWVGEEELLAMRLAPSDRRYAEWRVGAAAGEPAE